eukprot:1073716-Amphidinium_carterae.1
MHCALCGSSTKCLELAPVSESMRKCAMPAHTTMNRKIQKNHTDDVSYTSQSEDYYCHSDPLPGLRAGRGAQPTHENELQYE